MAIKIIYNTLWYGAFLLAGITLGLILYPSVTHAGAVFVDDFDSYTVGNLAGQGTWLQNGSLQSANVYATVNYSPANSMEIDRSKESGNVSIRTYFATTSVDSNTLSWRWYNTANTSGGNGQNWTIYNYTSAGTVDGAQYICVYASSTTQVEYRMSTTSSNCSSGFDASALYNENTWNEFVLSYDIDTNIVTLTINGTETLTRYYNDNADYLAYMIIGYTGATTYTKDYYDDFGFYSGGGIGGTVTDNTYITSVYPEPLSFGNSTTTYISAGVTIPSLEYYNYDEWRLLISCSDFGEVNSWWKLDTKIFKQEVLLDEDCAGGSECFPIGISWPTTDLEENAQYNCTASLDYDKPWFPIWVTLETYKWSFYTFESSSSPAWFDYVQSSDYTASQEDLTGSSSVVTVFESCEFWSGNFNFENCMYAPWRYAFIPTQVQLTEIQDTADEKLFTQFPFYYMYETQGVIEGIGTTSTTSDYTLPVITFEATNTSGGTSTITIFDGGEFTSTWVTFENEFQSIKDWISTFMILGFVMLLFFRIKRIVPSSDSIRGT